MRAVTTDANREPSDEMWRLQIVMLEHAAKMAKARARETIGIASGLHPSQLVFQGDLGPRGRGKASSVSAVRARTR